MLASAVSIALFCGLLWVVSHGTTTQGPDPQMDGVRTIVLVGLMFVSGVIGACLYSVRGLIKHSSEDDYDERYNYWYLLSPLAGGMSGIVVFFLLLGGALALTVTPEATPLPSLAGFKLAPYIAFSLLAGYASRSFMLKMKDVADSLFALSKKNNSD